MQVLSNVSTVRVPAIWPDWKTSRGAYPECPECAECAECASGTDAPNDTPEELVKLRGCRVSAPLPQMWGGRCRIVEWIDRSGEYVCMAVPDAATVDEIRERMRAHRRGLLHTLTDDPDAPRQRARLPRA